MRYGVFHVHTSVGMMLQLILYIFTLTQNASSEFGLVVLFTSETISNFVCLLILI